MPYQYIAVLYTAALIQYCMATLPYSQAPVFQYIRICLAKAPTEEETVYELDNEAPSEAAGETSCMLRSSTGVGSELMPHVLFISLTWLSVKTPLHTLTLAM